MAAQELYRNYCDLVCEGGGVKGIGLAGVFSVPRPCDLDLLGEEG